MRCSLQSPLDLAGFQAAGANINPPRGPIDHRLYLLNVRSPQSFGFDMRMADLKTAGLTLTTYLTYLRHGIPPFRNANTTSKKSVSVTVINFNISPGQSQQRSAVVSAVICRSTGKRKSGRQKLVKFSFGTRGYNLKNETK